MAVVEMRTSRLQSVLRMSLGDCRGNVGVIFALLAVVLVTSVGMALDYTRASKFRAQYQKAADSAALAATTAMVQGQSIEAARKIAGQFFTTNAPSGTGTASSVSITPTITSSAMTTTVSYRGSMRTTLSQILHINAIPLAVTATAQALSASSRGGTHYAGNGSVAGDPHIAGGDGSSGYLACAIPSGSWYNLLSDSEIEVNVSCVSDPEDGQDVIQSFSVLLGTHVVSLYAPLPTFDAGGNATYDPATAWFGKITIDGVTYAPAMGSHSYLGGMVSTNITDLTNFYASDNMVHITTATYNIFITYDLYAMGDINITATNAGLCGVPGGFWGGTLAGHDDRNGSDFLVSGPTATTSQFNWATCPGGTHLVK